MSNLSNSQKDVILNQLAELAAGNGTKKEASTLDPDSKEMLVNSILSDPSGRGMKRIAYAMTEPLRKKLDYLGIGRKLLETDLLPQGVIAAYDQDFTEVPAVKVAARGNPPTVESWSQRIEVETFDIATRRSIKYSEISIRRFNALDRAKNKAAFELKIAEDDAVFSAINTAAALTPNGGLVSVTGNITRSALASAWQGIEASRLVVGNVLMHPYAFQGFRGTWSNSDFDPVNMQAVLESGWFGSLWGAKLYVTDRLNQLTSANTPGGVAGTNTMFVLGLPMQLGRFPIRYDVEIKPFFKRIKRFIKVNNMLETLKTFCTHIFDKVLNICYNI